MTAQLPERTAYGYAWHGFWQQNLYKLNENFGTEANGADIIYIEAIGTRCILFPIEASDEFYLVSHGRCGNEPQWLERLF